MKRSLFCDSFTGLITKSHSAVVESVAEKNTHPCAVAACKNIIFDNFGAARTINGDSLLYRGRAHSVFKNGDFLVFVLNRELVAVDVSGEIYGEPIVLKSGVYSRLSWADVNGDSYFVSMETSGVISDGALSSWPQPFFERETNRAFSPPPVASVVAFYAGRVVLGSGKDIFFSEPLNFGSFDYGRNAFGVPGEVIGLAAVGKGLYVHSRDGVRFLTGTGRDDFDLGPVVSKDPAKPFGISPNLVDASLFGDGYGGLAAIWAGSQGVYLGLSDGTIVPLSQKSLSISTKSESAAVVFDGEYIFSTI